MHSLWRETECQIVSPSWLQVVFVTPRILAYCCLSHSTTEVLHIETARLPHLFNTPHEPLGKIYDKSRWGSTSVRQWSDLPFPITRNVIFSQGVFFYFFLLNFFTMYYKAVYIVYMRVATSQLFQVLFEACVERFWLAMYVFSCFVSYDGICVVQSSKVGMHS